MAELVESPRVNRDVMSQLSMLRRRYEIVGSEDDVVALLEDHPDLYALLLDAIKPLNDAFGQTIPLQIRVLHGADETLIRAAAQLPKNAENPEAALHAFDAAWWTENNYRSTSNLVFDYELQDGF